MSVCAYVLCVCALYVWCACVCGVCVCVYVQRAAKQEGSRLKMHCYTMTVPNYAPMSAPTITFTAPLPEL